MSMWTAPESGWYVVGDGAPKRACEWAQEDKTLRETTFCTRPSRFRVERGDKDPAYMPAEACEEHLADTIATLLEGQDIAAIVTVRWDE